MTVGPAVFHEDIAAEYAVTWDLPCADFRYLAPVKRSAAFRELRTRLAGNAPHPVHDSWLDDGFHFFVFALDSPEIASPQQASFAVFAMHPDAPEPISAVTVIPTTNDEAEITNLLPPGGSYVVPLPLHEQQMLEN